MSVGGDLGFSYPVLVLGLVGLVIALVVRRKWRISVARSKEVKRLMVLASEEAARVELEANASGKCQIVHWRQGHKEECRPFTPHQINDVGDGSCQKVLKQEDEIHRSSFGAEGTHCTKSVKNFPEEPARSKSNCFPEVFSVNDDHEVECLADGKGTNCSSYETERSDGHQRTNIFPAKLETNCVNNVDQNGLPSSKKTSFLGSVDHLPSSVKLNQIKLNCTNHNIKHGPAGSSGWSAGGTNESTFSESSTPSSGFWEGTIKSSRPKIDAIDDSARSSFGGAGDGGTYNVEGASIDRNHGPPIDVKGSDTTSVIADGSCSAALGVKKPIDMDILSKERNENALKGKNSPLSMSEKSNHMEFYTRSNSPVLKSGEPRNKSSSAYAYPTSSAGGSSFGTHASKVSSMRSLSSERSNRAVNGMHTTLRPLESEGGSLSTGDSVAHLLSTTRRQGAKSGKDDGAYAIAANSSVFASSSPNARNGMKTSMLKVFDQLRAKPSQPYRSGIGSEIVGRYNNKGLFPYDLFVKLYNWNSIELRPCGLTNCGNSCYANAVLQCLACTPPLTAYFLKGLHSKACGRKKWCFTCELGSLILKAKEGTSPLSPIGILSQMQNIGSQLGNGSEEDAHEFLRYAIDTMQSVCLNEAGVSASRSLEEETTLIGLTFGGYLRSKIKCTKCGGKSERYERMMDLTVEIGGNIGTLEEALRQFTGTEILDGENKYQCGRCRSYERAKKKLRILEAPNVLTIALKRFQSGEYGKLNKSIRFPEILDLAPYMSGTSDKSPIYRLYGVVVHLDVMNAVFSGHYVCYVKNVQNKWFEIDDSTVKAVELESVLTKGAYMLLYARCSPRAPRLIRNSMSTRDPRKPKNPIKSRSLSTGPWDAYGHAGIERLYSNNMSFRPSRPISEEDSLSDNSSSLFSEGNSNSTESSNRDSTSTDDYFDSLFGDVAGNWNGLWRNSSDSDSSSSSSSSSPSPLYSRHSSVAETDQYSSKYPETSHAGNPSFWERQPCMSSDWDKASEPFLYSDRSKECRKLGSSGSCRETNSDRVGWANSMDIKKSGLSLRRSMRERTD